MRRLHALGLIGLAIAVAGCTSTSVRPRGQLAMVSTRAKAVPMRVVADAVAGKTCQIPHQFGLAVQDALAKAPGANAMVNVQFTVRGTCLEATGTAVSTTVGTPVKTDAE